MDKKRVPKKNIEPVLVDIKKPDFNYDQVGKFESLNLQRIAGEYKKKSSGFPFISFFKWGIGFILFFIIIFAVFGFINIKTAQVTLEAKGESASSHLFKSLDSFKNLETDEAQNSLIKSKEKLDEIDKFINNNPKNFVLSAGFKFVPFLKNVGGFLKQITEFNIDLINLSSIFTDLQHNGFSYFQNDGDKLIDLLKKSQDLVKEIKDEVNTLRNQANEIKDFSYFSKIDELLESNYFVYSKNLYVIEDFLNGLVELFDSDDEKHILLMFQNSSELRPAGGFLGSYGEIIIKNGRMKELVVEDIYWPDHEINFNEKYIAPEPLQRITKDWGARDANWFFDFSVSAENTMNMLERSKLYKDENIEFEGAIAINVNVLGSIMDNIEEIKLDEYEMVIDGKNFLAELQREVEVGKDKQAGENPKKILSVLAPKIIEKLENLSEDEMKNLINILSSHVENKDVMFYARDRKLTSLFRNYGIGGRVYEVPDSFWGSYLAVVNSNIAGGKSDAFTKQDINLWLNVNSEGGVLGDLNIIRTHEGQFEEDGWYRATNKDYMKIFTNSGSNLIFADGNSIRTEILKDYESDYIKLPVLDYEENKIYNESQNIWITNEFGKQVFATWVLTDAGEISNFELRYENPSLDKFELKEGKKFRFVFDKQSGSDSSLNLKISAPLGYVWEESDSSIYKYETDNVSKRIIIDLTLKEN
jgi:hypothetical protein